MSKVFNDEAIMFPLISTGISFGDNRKYLIMRCVKKEVPGKSFNYYNVAYFEKFIIKEELKIDYGKII